MQESQAVLTAPAESPRGPVASESTRMVQIRRTESVRSKLPPKPKSARYESITIWRGVACMLLVLYHAAFYADHSWRLRDRSTWTLGGFAISCIDRTAMGVPIFFVVSGYCIAASVDSLRRAPRSLRTYFVRRFRRIYPPLWAAYLLSIVVTLLVVGAIGFGECRQLPRFSQMTVSNWVGNFTASESWLHNVRAIVKPQFLMQNTWTLCYEEQFYAVTGLLLAIASRRFFGVSYLIALATLASRHICRAAGLATDGFFFDGLWILFAGGILVYECLNYFDKTGTRITFAALSIAATYGAVERVLCRTRDDRQFGEYLLAASAFAILLIILRRWDSAMARHWLLKPLNFCGNMSYSVFLTHYPFVVLLSCWLARVGIRSDGWVFLIVVPLSVAVSVPVAWLFHIGVERHFLNSPLKSQSKQSRCS